MHQVASILMRLNMATQMWHPEADEPWLRLLDAGVTKSDYLAQLVRMYGFEAPLEGACAYTPQLGRVVELRQLTRAGFIAQDLLELGLRPVDLAAIPQCFSITPFHDVAEAMGWLYVIERSTLLHDRVRRHLLARLPEVSYACAYLSAFDGAVGERWQTFGKTIDRIGQSAKTANRIVESAHEGFQRLLDWFRVARTIPHHHQRSIG